MVHSLFYRRPAKASSELDSSSTEIKKQAIHDHVAAGCSCANNGVPEALSFEKIVEGGACPPCSARDFMNYLKYVEYSAENLQFFLWYRSYVARWSQLPENESKLSPECIASDTVPALTFPKAAKTASHAYKEIESNVSASPASGISNPFSSSPSTVEKAWSDSSSADGDTAVLDTKVVSEKSVEASQGNTGATWLPLSTQPYRSEITRIITTYLAPGAPRELNISGRERQAVLQALQKTTHPSAFAKIATSVEYSLRKQAHPNFVRWTICNGNRPRVIFARGLGIFGIATGLIADLVITLSSAPRAYRVIPIIAWFIGIATLFAACKGMCVVLHGLHHRHLRPWELFEDGASDDERPSWDSLTSSSSNSFEDEPWVKQYEKRNTIRKIFDREVWIEEPALRQLQDTIFLQALLGSFILSCIIVGIFCAVPAGNLF